MLPPSGEAGTVIELGTPVTTALITLTGSATTGGTKPYRKAGRAEAGGTLNDSLYPSVTRLALPLAAPGVHAITQKSLALSLVSYPLVRRW